MIISSDFHSLTRPPAVPQAGDCCFLVRMVSRRLTKVAYRHNLPELQCRTEG